MGLDMFLNKRLSKKTADDEVQVGYWRKANHIHKWFVDEVQEGIDDCGEYEVSHEQLKDLLFLVNEVLLACVLTKGKIQNGETMNKDGKWEPIMEDGFYVKDHTIAEQLLPCQSGFFFGPTNYDQYYVEDLKTTKQILENALADKDAVYYYSSSW